MTLCTYGGRFARTSKTGQPDRLEIDDWMSVFSRQHATDAHAWPYVRYVGGEQAPAIRAESKAGIPQTEGDILCGLVFLDFDESNDHQAILTRFTQIPESSPLVRFAALYPTLGGMRFVYRLAEPVLPEEYGQITRGLSLELFKHTQLKVDTSTDQWWRCFRLPSVTRDDNKAKGPTWETGYYFEPLLSEDVLDPDALPHVIEQLPWKKGRTFDRAPKNMPDADHSVAPSRLKVYKKVLRGSRFKEYLFDDLEILPGRRDETLMAMTAEVVSKCYFRMPECSAEEVFALLTPVALSFTSDGSEPWTEKLWRFVQHCWDGEVKKNQDRNDKIASDRSARDVILDNLTKQMPENLIPNDPGSRLAFMQRHLILQAGNSIYPVTPDGTYSTRPIRDKQVAAYLNDEGLNFLAPDRFRNERGAMLSSTEILNRNSAILDSVNYVAGTSVTSRIESHGDRLTLTISPFGLRQDLLERAEYDAEVDAWLDSFPNPAQLKLWLAAALAIDRGPVCALYMMGPARAGKSMLAMGLAECFGSSPATGGQAFSEYNGALQDTPIVLVDEGLPRLIGGLDTADLFRSLVTGSGISVMRKYHDSTSMNIPYRILFAANSFNMVTSLVGHRSLTGQDKRAFEERILVLETGSGPADFLDSKGAMSHTKEDKKGSWIGGSSRLARHLIRNYQMHFEEAAFARAGRMLVQGEPHPGLLLTFDLSGHGAEVIDSLVTSLTAFRAGQQLQKLAPCLQIVGGKACVKKLPFAKLQCFGRNASRPQFAEALDRFCTGETRYSATGSLMHVIDVDKVIFCAKAVGLEVEALEKIAETSKGIA